jgi:hypothetical protein
VIAGLHEHFDDRHIVEVADVGNLDVDRAHSSLRFTS